MAPINLSSSLSLPTTLSHVLSISCLVQFMTLLFSLSYIFLMDLSSENAPLNRTTLLRPLVPLCSWGQSPSPTGLAFRAFPSPLPLLLRPPASPWPCYYSVSASEVPSSCPPPALSQACWEATTPTSSSVMPASETPSHKTVFAMCHMLG